MVEKTKQNFIIYITLRFNEMFHVVLKKKTRFIGGAEICVLFHSVQKSEFHVLLLFCFFNSDKKLVNLIYKSSDFRCPKFP